MENNKIKFKELPKGIKFATFNPQSGDVILAEYLIASSIYNGASFNQLLESANEVEDIKEREDIKVIITNVALDFINLNPEYIYLLNDGTSKNFRFYCTKFF